MTIDVTAGTTYFVKAAAYGRTHRRLHPGYLDRLRPQPDDSDPDPTPTPRSRLDPHDGRLPDRRDHERA